MSQALCRKLWILQRQWSCVKFKVLASSFSSQDPFREPTMEILLGKLTKRLFAHCSLVTLHSRASYLCPRWEKGSAGRGRIRLGSLHALCLCEARLISWQCGCETSPEIPPPPRAEGGRVLQYVPPHPSYTNTARGQSQLTPHGGWELVFCCLSVFLCLHYQFDGV